MPREPWAAACASSRALCRARKTRTRSCTRRSPNRRTRPTRTSSLPEARLLERLLELLDRLRVDARAEVLPAVVGHHEDDVALVELARDPDRHAGDGAARDAHEEALLLEQLLGPDHRIEVRDEDLPVEQREVDDRRDEAVVERAQPLHEVALERLGGDDERVRVLLLEPAAVAHQRPAGAEPGDERRDLVE